jgi:hypothetical protein
MLLAFAASPEEVEVLLISLTFGNIEVQRCVYFYSFPVTTREIKSPVNPTYTQK